MKRKLRYWLAATSTAMLAAGGLASVAGTALAAPCTTSSPTGACGPYSDPSVFTGPNGADLVVQNDFSAIPQTLTSNADNNWTVAASTVGQSDQTSVKSYPATQVTYTLTNGMPEPSADFGTSLTSAFTNVVPSGSGQDYEYAFDDWLADPAKPSWTNDLEVMIWTDVNNQVPAGSDTGTHYTDPAGVNWEVWVAGGATTVSPDSTVSFVRATNTDNSTIDRMGFYGYLQSHGMLASTYGIDQTNYGLEICSTGGATRTYGISNYTEVVNGTGGGGGTAPVVTTGAASGVTSTSATLNGTVNPEGAATTYQFEYGTTTSYGSVAPASPGSAGSGSSAVAESAAVTGLTASTGYHYRLDATNATGTTDGPDQAFTTSAGGGGGTAVAFDAAGGAKRGAGTSMSWTQVVGSGTNRALVADFTIGTSNDAGCAPTVTDNGVAMTEITAVHDNNQRAGVLTVWGRANPPSGTNTIAVSVAHCTAAPSELTGGSESFTGVSQSAPFGVHATGFGSGATSSVADTAASTSDLMGEFVSNGNSITSPVSPVVQKFLENQDANTGAGNTAGGYAPATGVSQTGQWHLTSDWWGAAAVDIAHA
jgi:hypothetical protein